MSRDHTCRISGAGAMVQTASTNEADRSHVPGATTIRVLGTILILQGGYRLYVVAGAVVVLFAQSGLFYQTPFALTLAGLCLSGVLRLLTIVAGVRLVRLDSAGRVFGLWVCSVTLAFDVLAFGLRVVALKLATTARPPGLLFWLLPALNIVLSLVAIILIARWHPPRAIEQLGRIFD